jgi:SAM-dependent methyltransferase
MTDDRERLRGTFDTAAQDYQQARPDYPGELYDALIQQAGLRPGDRLLEVGCATGKATLPLARRGFRITCLDTFFDDLQDVYDEIGAGLPPGSTIPRPEELPAGTAEIEAGGLFGAVTAGLFDWEVSYTADEYIRLLDTFSGHLAMAAWQRDRLYGEIRRRLAERPDGRLRRHWGAVLRVARRRDNANATP